MKKHFLLLLALMALLLPGNLSLFAADLLKQSTATEIPLEFVDATDGITAETGLDVTTFDCTIYKHADANLAATALTVTASGGSNDSTHLADGVYRLELTASNTDTLGRFRIKCQCSGAAPFSKSYMVVSTSVYEASVTSASSIADFWNTATSGFSVAGSIGKMLVDDTTFTVTGTADSGTTTTLVDAALTQADTDYFKGQLLCLTSGTAAQQCRTITAFTPASDTITVSPAFTQAVSTDTYEIHPRGSVDLNNLIGTLDAAEIGTDAIGASQIAASAITSSEAPLLGTIQSDTDDIQSRLPAALISGRIDATVGAMQSDVVTAASVATSAIGAAELADGAIDRATFAAETGLQSIRANTAQAGASNSLTLDAGASAVTDFYINGTVYITGNTGAGQARVITAYNGSTKVATVNANWGTNPDSSSTFAILPTGLSPAAAGLTAADVWAYATRNLSAGAITSGTFAADSITASAIATDAIGAAELADNAIGAAEVATGAIDAGAFAADAITATVISTDAIGAAELAADSITSSELATSAAAEIQTGLLTVPKNTAYNNFTLEIVDSAGTLITGATVACTVSKDGAAPTSCANSVTEVGSGLYKTNVAATDLNADEALLRFVPSGGSGTGRRVTFKIRTQR